MKLLKAVPPQLMGRFAPNSVPMACDCGVMFLWEKALGDIAVCPSCKAAGNVDGTGAMVTDPALKVAADQPFDNSSIV